jgi:hypothetical protein
MSSGLPMKKVALTFLSLLILLVSWYFFSQYDQHKNLTNHSISAKGLYARIPIQFIGNNALIEVEIEGGKYPVKLDLGASCQFAFFSDALETLCEKKFIEFITTTDVKGNQYKVKNYLIPHIKTKNFKCENVNVLEESRDFVRKGAVLWQSDDKIKTEIPFVGRIGRNCFMANNLFIDFPNSMVFVTSGIDQLKMDHWRVCDLFETSFEMGLWGIILSIETDLGVKRFVLDTGANVSILRESHLKRSLMQEAAPGRQIFTTEKFVMGGQDFGPFDLSVFEIASSVDADGYLGLDFLKEHAIYLDFKNNKAFIGPSSKVCGAIIF